MAFPVNAFIYNKLALLVYINCVNKRWVTYSHVSSKLSLMDLFSNVFAYMHHEKRKSIYIVNFCLRFCQPDLFLYQLCLYLHDIFFIYF